MMSLICGIYDTNELIHKAEIDSQTKKANLWLSKRKRAGINLEFGINRYTLYVYKINKKDLLYGTGNYIQYLVIIYNRKEFEIHIYTHVPKLNHFPLETEQCKPTTLQ